MFRILSWIVANASRLCGLVLVGVAIYFGIGLFTGGRAVSDMRAWLLKNGDAEMLKYYEEASLTQKKAVDATRLVYERLHGKAVGADLFKKETASLATANYADLLEVALALPDAEDRDAFLDAHSAAYEACIRSGMMDVAHRYAATLEELRKNGGKAWRTVSRNPFAICVYENLKDGKDCHELLDWYYENAAWCDAFLMTCEPEQDEAPLKEALLLVRREQRLLRKFAEEIEGLSDRELESLARGGNRGEVKESLYAATLAFVEEYREALQPLLDCQAPMFDSMAAIANNGNALKSMSLADLGNELARIYCHHKNLWSHVVAEDGVGVVLFYKEVPQWAESLLETFPDVGVVVFLNKHFAGNPELLRSAAEVLYKCQEPGWAVLYKYRDNSQFKEMLQHPKIGFRVVPYILKKGAESAFVDLLKDPRWADEYFDSTGNLKRQDVSWYELSPVGGDLATVVKKWVENRPVSMSEIGWAAFDVGDGLAMAFSLGMSKAVTTAGKKVGKSAVKRFARSGGEKIAVTQVKNLEKSMARGLLPKGARAVPRTKSNLSFLGKISNRFKNFGNPVETAGKTIGRKGETVWKKLRQVSPETWETIYKSSKMLMWVGVWHKVGTKGSDFMHGVLVDFGKFAGNMTDACVAGIGDALKVAVKEAFDLGQDLGGWKNRAVTGLLLLVLLWGASRLLRRASATEFWAKG